jgi:hypothetical protein
MGKKHRPEEIIGKLREAEIVLEKIRWHLNSSASQMRGPFSLNAFHQLPRRARALRG